MDKNFRTERFEFYLKDDSVSERVLWENHCHTGFEMISVVSGDVSVILEGRRIRLTAGNALFIPPLFYHSIVANAKGKYRRLTVLFGEEAIPEEMKERFLKAASQSCVFHPENNEKLEEICRDGVSFYAPLADSIMTENFYSFLLGNTEGKGEIDGELKKILDFIEEHLFDKITLDDVARHVSLSKSSVCHTFKSKMNIPLKKYLLDKRLALSAKMIKDGVPATAVASKMGYGNYSNFYRVYKSHLGAPPVRKKVIDLS